MKVGDYVRTKYGIAKYICDYGMYYAVDKGIMTCNVEGWENYLSGSNEIVKSSPNIIDLIEVGDYVNGSYVEGFIEKNKFQNKLIITEAGMIDNNDVKTIATREQFKNVEYEVR